MLPMSRRAVLAGLASTGALALSGCAGATGPYPSRSVEMTVGFGAGGLNDTVGRFFAKALGDQLGERVLVVNRAGGGGIIAATEARNVRPDGYQVFLAPVGAFTSGPLLQTVGYSLEDFRSVAPVAQSPFGVVVSADAQERTIEDLMSRTGELSYAVLGNGNPSHVIAGKLTRAAGFTGRAIPFDSSVEALLSVSNGEVDFGAVDLPSLPPMLRTESVRLLATATPERMTGFPDVPTTEEAGIPDSVFTASQGLVVSNDVPTEVTDVLGPASERAIASDEYQEFLETNLLSVPDVDGPAYFTEYLPREQQRYREAFQQLGIRSSRR